MSSIGPGRLRKELSILQARRADSAWPPTRLAHRCNASSTYFWLVEWNLEGRPPENQRVLPYPNAHLVFDQGRTAIHGVVRGAFDRTVEGAGRVLGVRFKPGGLRPFIDQPLSRLADRTMPVDDVLKIAASEAEQRVLGQDSDQAMVAAAESMLLASLPPADPRAILAEQAVNAAAAVNGPASVGALAAQLGVEERSLQRLFSNYVGVSPKWVIQRFRLQEASWRLATCASVDLAALAGQLGFFAQAHFTTRQIHRTEVTSTSTDSREAVLNGYWHTWIRIIAVPCIPSKPLKIMTDNSKRPPAKPTPMFALDQINALPGGLNSLTEIDMFHRHVAALVLTRR